MTAGWDLLPVSDPATPTASELIEALDRTPNALVLYRDRDPTTAALVATFPELDRHVRERFEIAARVGRYRLWRRRAAAP